MNNEEKIIAYLTGDMKTQEQVSFEQELEQSEVLQQELEEYKSMFSIIEDMESMETPKSVSSRFNQMLDGEIEKLKSEKTKTARLRPNYFRLIGIAASFALLGLFIGHQMQSNSSTNEMVNGLDNDKKNEFIQLVSQDRTSKKINGIEMLENASLLEGDVLEALENILFNDPSTNVRLAVIDAMKGRIDQQEVKEVLIKGLKSIEKPMVRIGIIQALAGTKSKQFILDLEMTLGRDDLDKAVRDELHVGIMQLSKNI